MNAISKKLLSMLLVTAMVLSMVPFGGLSIFAVETNATEVAPASESDPATTGVNAPIDFTTSTTHVCPVCGGDAVTWQPLTAITAATTLESGHYYVPEGGVTNTAQYNLNTNAVRCIYLNGQTLSSSVRVSNLGYNATLNVFGSGTVKSTAKGYGGSVYYLSGTCTVNLYGGTHAAPNADSTGAGYPLKLEATGAKLYIYDGATISTAKWRTVYMTAGTVTMNGGTINGGNVYGKNGGTVLMEGGTFNMKGGTIQNTYAITGNGANLYMSGGTFNMIGGTIQGGSAANGGNVYVGGGTFNMTGGTIQNGTASANGGNIATASKALTIGGNVLNGTAATGGGNISGSTGSVLTVSGTVAGGTVTGTAGSNWGGNIYAWQATVNVQEGATIYGGTCGNTNKASSSNIGCLGETSTAALNISGGNIAGDISVNDYTSVKLSGTPTIKMSLLLEDGTTTVNATNSGMTFSTANPIDISELQADADIDLTGAVGSVFTTASENATNVVGCFTPVNSELKVQLQSDNTLKLVENTAEQPSEDVFDPENFGGQAYCPVCEDFMTWSVLPAATTANVTLSEGHYYIPEAGISNSYNYVVANKVKVCLHLNDSLLTTTSNLMFNAYGQSTLNICGEGEVRSQKATNTGSIVYLGTTTVNLHGGTFTGPNITTGNLFKDESEYAKLNIYEGATITSKGRAIQINQGSVTMDGGTINGGAPTSGDGGAIIMEGGKFTMNDGTITGGTAANGGNIAVNGGTATVNGGTISGGNATNQGGNIHITGGTFTMNNGTITGGNAKTGGSVNVAGATFNMSGGTINSGTSTGQGGTMRVIDSTVNLSGTSMVYAGSASNAPGIWLIDSALNMSGSSKVYGNGTSGTGNAVYATHSAKGSTVTLDGEATIRNATGTSSNNLFVNYHATYSNKLNITNGWTGVAYLRALNSEGEAFGRGEAVTQAQTGTITDGAFTAGGTFSGSLYYSPESNRPMKGRDGAVYVALALITNSEGTTYYVDYADALEAYYANNGFENGDYLKLASNDAELVLNGPVYVDSIGWSANVSGTGTLYALDSANDDYDGCSTWTVSGDVEVAPDTVNPVNGNRYIVIKNKAGENKYSARRIEVKLTAVTLRASEAGLYYKASYKCDGTLADRISAYGVALNTTAQPDKDFLTNPKTGFSCLENFSEVHETTGENAYTVATTSGAVFGIFKDATLRPGTGEKTTAQLNAEYGKMKIFANTYFVVNHLGDQDADNDYVAMGDINTDSTDDVAYSLWDALKAINDNWDTLIGEDVNKQKLIADFYGTWNDAEVVGSDFWAGLDKITALSA